MSMRAEHLRDHLPPRFGRAATLHADLQSYPELRPTRMRDDELCPPCPYLTQKKCLCGKKAMKNIPCWRTEVLCGLGYANLDTKWSHIQEEILRIFAADEQERRLRMKPMKPHHRAFIHSLSTDFGFDTESLDPEPHRHVVVLKTPKFVAAPMKTLGQAARIRKVKSTVVAPTKQEDRDEQQPGISQSDESHPRYNGFLLAGPKFALTVDEVKSHLATAVPSMSFDVAFLPEQDAVALTTSRDRHWEIDGELEEMVKRVKPQLVSETSQEKLATFCSLCSFDTTVPSSPTIVYKEPRSDTSSLGAGWSQIASKKAASAKPAPTRAAVGQRPIYTVLGSKLAEAKRKKLEEEELKKRREQEFKEVSENWDDELEKEGVSLS
ncbi:MAG: hypothetical protein Q9160_005871 [Pyrenula sp. 1 TL-2023]